jgi:hypothetical protein
VLLVLKKCVLVLGSEIDGKLPENMQKFENRQVPVSRASCLWTPGFLGFLTFILLPTPAC